MSSTSHVLHAPDRAALGRVPALGSRPTHDRYEPSPTDDDDPSDHLLQTLDVLGDGFILTDASSRVLHLNRAARTMVADGSLAVRNGLLCARTLGDTRALHAVIADRAQGQGADAYLRTACPSVRRAIFLTVTAVRPGEPAPDRTRVVTIARDLDRVRCPSPGMIRAFFGLTPAEAGLAHEITKGDGLSRCAHRLGITISTARSHLKHVFEKTGTKRQAELVRLLFCCGVSVADQRPASARSAGPSAIRLSDRRRGTS